MNYKHRLDALQTLDLSTFELFLRVMAIITESSQNAGLLPIVVGGHAVSLYTRGDYATRDVDLVAPDNISGVLDSLGFVKAPGDRHWFQEELNVAIEIPDRQLAGSMDKVIKLDLGDLGYVFVIGVEDLILDRLRACVYWKSSVDCEWAQRLYLVHREATDDDYIRAQITKEAGALEIRRIFDTWATLTT